jgi:hypothetical protein
LSQFFNK